MTKAELRFYAICRFIAVGASRLWWPGGVVGREHLPLDSPFILAPVHRSNVDWLIVARVTRRRLRYLVKGEVWKVKSVGRLLEMLGTFPVQRGTADREALSRCVEVLRSGEPLVVFPEGTRGSGDEIGELREGVAYLALRANVPVVPVGVSGMERSLPRGKKLPRPVHVKIVVGAPIYPAAAPATGAGTARVGAGGASGAGSPEAGGEGRLRVSRSATHDMSARVRSAVQSVFDEAEGRPPRSLVTKDGG